MIAQPSGSDDFMLERLRFQSLMGYWMSEPLYAFTVSQATLEDYCSQDLKQAYRRIDELSLEQGDDPFNGFSAISFADCAHAMLNMLQDDTWLHKAPIIQY